MSWLNKMELMDKMNSLHNLYVSNGHDATTIVSSVKWAIEEEVRQATQFWADHKITEIENEGLTTDLGRV